MSESGQSCPRPVLGFMLSPWAILIAMAAGVVFGAVDKPLAAAAAPVGAIYLSLLQMCILPILLSAVASSLGGLVRQKETRSAVRKVSIVFAVGLISTAALGLAAGLIGRPGMGLSERSQTILGEIVGRSSSSLNLEMNFSGPNEQVEKVVSIGDFFLNVVPSNVVESMALGKNLQVLFFAAVLGVAAGLIPYKQSAAIMAGLDGLYLAFAKVIHWALYVLPLGLFFLMADQVSKIGAEMLVSMTRFVVVFHVAGAAVLLANVLVIRSRSGLSFPAVFSALKVPTLIALGTRSSFATIPSALHALHDGIGLHRQSTNLVLPLAVAVCRFGNVLYFALATVFVAQLYGVTLGVQGLIVALLGSVLAGMATSGATGVVTLSMLALVLQPLGLPLEAVLVLFIAIDPIVDPLRSLLIVHSACAATALVAPREPVSGGQPCEAGEEAALA